LFIVLSVIAIIMNASALPKAVSMIFSNIFGFKAMAGGFGGYVFSQVIKKGMARGVFSNEAGLGSSVIAHSASETREPVKQGLWGIFEVFADTIVLCTATALVILVSGVDMSAGGVMMTVNAYSSVLGGFADWFFCVAVFCFGYATLLCWGNYGLESVRFLSRKKRWRILYVLAFGLCILFGVRSAPEFVWGIGDFGIATMTAINLCVLFLLRREIKQETLLFAKKGKREDASPI
jgi:AGCS family alanine or glycine:cation symporter